MSKVTIDTDTLEQLVSTARLGIDVLAKEQPIGRENSTHIKSNVRRAQNAIDNAEKALTTAEEKDFMDDFSAQKARFMAR